MPRGEKRPADVIVNAVLSMKVDTGDAEERYVNAGQSVERLSRVAKEGEGAAGFQCPPPVD